MWARLSKQLYYLQKKSRVEFHSAYSFTSISSCFLAALSYEEAHKAEYKQCGKHMVTDD